MVHSSHPYPIKPWWHLDSSVIKNQSSSLTLFISADHFCWDQKMAEKRRIFNCWMLKRSPPRKHSDAVKSALSTFMHLLVLAVCVFWFLRVALPFPSSSVTPLPACVLLSLDGPEFGRVVVSFCGISQHSCNDKLRSALWPTKPNPQTHSSRVIPDGGSLRQERRRCYIFIAAFFRGFQSHSRAGQRQ